ncbi:MAG: hypothetical protein J6T31_00030 [Methanobrevibacter sp.]|nr:hypothetical protein [Methanobrevibacter sp.]
MGKRSFKKAFRAQDEYFTPGLLVDMLVPYLEKWEIWFSTKYNRQPVIWLPFDTEESKYYTILKEKGFQVVRSHLNDDKDFFLWQPGQFDLIVSNPPFSRKLEVFERIIFDLKKPFVLLMNMMAINYQEIGNLFQFVNPKIQFIIPDKKVSFDGNTSSFCSGYVCYDFIDHTEFCHLAHNNTGNNFSK